ncbi:hypothetical protein R1sor_008126 [Riccia sorocarpa]|uniref:Endonuclease/exonuclease/phosphatase domain-containing protein n=1 Tax=Riccia sorocarpa TaxID=122646 RepID=A0ABD3HWJ5_9MARC
MLLSLPPALAAVGGRARAFKRLYRGIFLRTYTPLTTPSFASSIRSLSALRAAMSAPKDTWKPTFTPVTDAGAATTNPICLLRLVSYNILAQAYVKSVNFPHSPRSCLRWKNRSEAVISRLLNLDADLLCLQELDEYHTFYRDKLDKAGYGSVYVQRGNGKKDGCGIFFKRSRITLLSEEIIDYNVLVPPPSVEEAEATEAETDDAHIDGSSRDGDEAARKIGDLNDVRVRLKRDCVGIIAAFKPLDAPDHIFILANTHIYWDPVLMDVKLAQAQHLASSLSKFNEKAAREYGVDPLVLVAGDFNSLPGDPVYRYLTSGSYLSKEVRERVPVEYVGSLMKEVQKLKVDSEVKEGEVREWVLELDGKTEFPLPAVSLYAYADEEPAFTNYTHDFVGTLDYILFVPCERLKPRTLLALPPPGAIEVTGGLPNHHHPSDHLPIGCDFGLY